MTLTAGQRASTLRPHEQRQSSQLSIKMPPQHRDLHRRFLTPSKPLQAPVVLQAHINDLSITLFNARSLVNKLENLHTMLLSCAYDIICVSETWLNARIPDSLLLVNSSYVVYRCDRLSTGGGVAIFVRSVLKCAAIVVLPSPFETIGVDIFVTPKLVISVYCVYISPALSNDHLSSCGLTSLLSRGARSSNPHFFLGDFNQPQVNWNIPCALSSCASPLVDAIIVNGLTQLVTDATHLHGNVLDLVNVSNTDYVRSCVVGPPFSSKCDHLSLTLTCDIPVFSPATKPRFLDFANAN